MSFPMLVSKRFVDAVQSREPMAVAVMAHYVVVLYRLRWIVWLQGWGEPLVVAAKEVLAEEPLDCIAWPIVQVE